MSTSSWESAVAAFGTGDRETARHHAGDVWQNSEDPRAASLLGLLDLEAGKPREALAWAERALGKAPQDVRLQLQAARLQAMNGDPTRAFHVFANVLELPAGDWLTDAVWRQFTELAIATSHQPAARAIVASRLGRDANQPGALLAFLNLLDASIAPPSAFPVVPLSHRSRISVVTCSVQDDRFAAASESYSRALGDWPHEIVRIPDAKSLAEGYNRGTEIATGEVMVFTHDDVDILPNNFGHRLTARMASCDVLGIAGATAVTGPAWGYAGRPHLHGCVVYPGSNGYTVTVYSPQAPLAQGIRLIDGVFFAMRRELASRVGWDADLCDGFHGYDVDFSLRAGNAGLRLAVASDLGIVHKSYGAFDDRWRASAQTLMQRYPILRSARGADTSFIAREVASSAVALNLVDQWSQAWAGAGDPR